MSRAPVKRTTKRIGDYSRQMHGGSLTSKQWQRIKKKFWKDAMVNMNLDEVQQISNSK